ncbi:DNA-binding transcriptional MerR regulator [Litorimonas taeanensis]|uniref:DNA-binding transcriptional MerR regulator n=1 Tax=Litorimonas taeanensis TaxID=568099 RepID=A0A420WKD7_9PROT|nr:MerR family transcriptional regulator [Litorimonas taeanensis]RKQ71419.1 DNA-binding transcriptional MerR regulator [Litorimonas taeanensis]
MQAKTTRAFRTISEAGEELDLQPHVLRFWESKFPQIKPIKRGGGRRFYRPEDIELLRGIKILLHDEGHPIKDVQKLMRLKGAARIIELGQSVEKAAKESKVQDTILVPERIKKQTPRKENATQLHKNLEKDASSLSVPPETKPEAKTVERDSEQISLEKPSISAPEAPVSQPLEQAPSAEALQHKQDLEEALERLRTLKSRWGQFSAKS